MIRFVSVNDLSVGRNPNEVLRVLDALQTGELTGFSSDTYQSRDREGAALVLTSRVPLPY